MTDGDAKEQSLYYRGTNIRIQVGDRILFPRWFRKMPATVVYVPGQSPKHSSMEYGDVRQWGIKIDGEPHNVVLLGYFPPDEVIPKRLEFVSRGDKFMELNPSEELL